MIFDQNIWHADSLALIK